MAFVSHLFADVFEKFVHFHFHESDRFAALQDSKKRISRLNAKTVADFFGDDDLSTGPDTDTAHDLYVAGRYAVCIHINRGKENMKKKIILKSMKSVYTVYANLF